MTTYANFLDWNDLLVKEVFGGQILFLLGTTALIFYLCIKFRLGDNAMLMLIALWILLISAAMKNMAFVGLILLIIAIFVAPRMTKLISR